MATKLEEKLKNLPLKQQVALWKLLQKTRKRGKFTIVNFIADMMPLFGKNDPEKLPKILGGILSSLARNGMVERLSGGRHPIWRLTPELHRNAKKYRRLIHPTYTYWTD